MAIDLSNLPVESGSTPQVDFDNYVNPTEFAPPIPEGTYNFKTTKVDIENFNPETGVVSFIMDHEAYDPNTGNKVGSINFDRISTKVFQRQNVPASMAADQLRATTGIINQPPSSPRQWGDQITAIKQWCDQGNFWSGAVQWDGYCSHDGTDKATEFDKPKGADGKRPAGSKPLATQPAGHFAPSAPKGMKNWPSTGVNGSGEHAAEVPCSICGQPIQARAKISRRIPK